MRSPHSERGAATVAACLALTALLAATMLFVQVGVVIVARHRAQAAADLGALAAAGALTAETDDACSRARELGQRMRVRVRSCTVVGWDVTVVAELTASLGPLGTPDVRAVARAGPVKEQEQ